MSIQYVTVYKGGYELNVRRSQVVMLLADGWNLQPPKKLTVSHYPYPTKEPHEKD